MAHVLGLIRLLVFASCAALTGCSLATMGVIEGMFNIAELGEYMTHSFDCSPSPYPDRVNCVETKLRIVDKIQATNLVTLFPQTSIICVYCIDGQPHPSWVELKEVVENDAKAEEKTLTNGLFNVLQDTVTVVSGNNFKRDENYWSPPKLYKTLIVEARRGGVHPEWPHGLWIRFRIYNFEHKGGSLIVPDKMLWSIVINYKSPTDQTPTPVDWKLALTVLSQRLEKIITRQ